MTDHLILTTQLDLALALQKSLATPWLIHCTVGGLIYQITHLNHHWLILICLEQQPDVRSIDQIKKIILQLNPHNIFLIGLGTDPPVEKMQLGDIIVAHQLWQILPASATTNTKFQPIATHPLNPQWQPHLQHLAQDQTWHRPIDLPRPKTYAHQKGWLLHTLYDHTAKPDLCLHPADHPDRPIHCPDWQIILPQLMADHFITPSDLRLTAHAIDLIRENRILHLDTGFPHDAPFPQIHLGTMAIADQPLTESERHQYIQQYAETHHLLHIVTADLTLKVIKQIQAIPILIIQAIAAQNEHTLSPQWRNYATATAAQFLAQFLTQLTFSPL